MLRLVDLDRRDYGQPLRPERLTPADLPSDRLGGRSVYMLQPPAELQWQLRGSTEASRAFVGPSCGLCSDPAWEYASKGL